MVDALKGYACFLVVFGHVIMGIRKSGLAIPYGAHNLEEFIWTFHVALFMFLSGYVYHITGEWSKKENRISFIKYKFINLAIPYFVFSIFYILVNSVLGEANVNNAMSVSDVVYLWKEPVAQYWFLYDLFFLFVSFTLLSKWLKNCQITLLLVMIRVIFYILKVSIPMPFAAMVRMALPFGLGASIKQLYTDQMSGFKKAVLIIIHFVFVEWVLYYQLDQYILVDFFIAVLGCFSSIALISSLVRIQPIEQILLWICKYSFPIYLLHTIFTAGIRVVLLKCGMNNYFVHVMFGCAVGIFIPVICSMICNKIDFLNFFFFPERILKKGKRSN